jgi:hypothetical protein
VWQQLEAVGGGHAELPRHPQESADRHGSHAAAGEKRVTISAMQVVGRRQVYEGDPNSPVVDDVREMIPPQYNAASTLTLKAEAGSQTQDFPLQSSP